MYGEMPFLWQKQHKDYKNKEVRYEGYKVLLEIYKNFDQDATLKTLKKKIENMRTNYAKELKKVRIYSFMTSSYIKENSFGNFKNSTILKLD